MQQQKHGTKILIESNVLICLDEYRYFQVYIKEGKHNFSKRI